MAMRKTCSTAPDFKLSRPIRSISTSASPAPGSRRRIPMMRRMRRRGPDWSWTTAAWARTACLSARRINARKSGRLTLRQPGRVCSIRTPCSPSAALCGRININYYPSGNPFADFTPDLQLQTIGQNRRLTNAGLRANISYVKGIHNMKVGAHVFRTRFSRKTIASDSSIRQPTRSV